MFPLLFPIFHLATSAMSQRPYSVFTEPVRKWTPAIFDIPSGTKYLALRKTRFKIKFEILKNQYIVLNAKNWIVMCASQARNPESACILSLQFKPIHYLRASPQHPFHLLLTLEQETHNFFSSHWHKKPICMREERWLQRAEDTGYKMQETHCSSLGKSIIRVLGRAGRSYKI